MRLLQRVGLFSITILLLLGFWAGLWYRGYRKSNVVFYSADESAPDSEAGGVKPGDTQARSALSDGVGANSVTPISIASDSAASDSAASDSAALSTVSGAVGSGLYDTGAPADFLAVHVVGCVASPGLYYMPPGSRIYDAVMEAEPEEEANLARINMALRVEDGMQIRVPEIGAVKPWEAEDPIVWPSNTTNNTNERAAGGTIANTSTASSSSKININKATATELQTLPGIGPAYSQRIIQYREQNGSFKSVEDLLKVKGIGPAKMSDLRDLVTCS